VTAKPARITPVPVAEPQTPTAEASPPRHTDTFGHGEVGSPSGRSKGNGKRRRLMLVASLLLIALTGGTTYWLLTRNLESTDDAFIDGDAVQITPKVGGTVVALHVTDNQAVKAGDPILDIDPRDYEVAVENARATLDGAEAQAAVARANLDLVKITTAATLEQSESALAHAQASLAQSQAQAVIAEAEAVRASRDAARYEELQRESVASRQRYEQAIAQSKSATAQVVASKEAIKVAAAQVGEARGQLNIAKSGPQQVAVKEAELAAAEAHVAASHAALDQVLLNLSYTKIIAPHDGIITKRNVQQGDVVQKDQSLGALVFGTPWVSANFKETQLTRMSVGQPVDITVDAYPDKVFKGRIDSIQRGTGAHFSLLPPENATGNFVKVVQRVPVKITFDAAPPSNYVLGLGMSVVPTVNVSAVPQNTPSVAQK
jgi:membrane fusion protein, multidrug efflux system